MNVSVMAVVTTAAKVDLWSPVVIALIPVLVMLLKRLIPDDMKREVTMLYPVMAIVLGPVVDYAFSLLTSHQTGPHAVLFGLVAIGLREIGDQGRKLVGTPAAKFAVIVFAGLACGGCLATRDIGYAGQHPGFQDIECKGKVAITGTASVAASLAYGGAGINSFSITGDCSDGFRLGRSQGMIGGGNASVIGVPR